MLDALEQRGLSLNPTSRIPRYIAILDAMLSKPRPLENLDVTTFLTAVVEGNYVLDVYEGLVEPRELPDWLKHFKKAADGRAELVEDDPSRNKMVELLIASLLNRIGVTVGFGDERPDVRILAHDVTYGVEAKRIRNADALERRVREASSQIAREKYPGFVVVDLTSALKLNHRPDKVVPIQEAHARLSALRQQVAELLPEESVDWWLQGRPTVAGVVGFAYFPLLVEGERGGTPFILRVWGQRLHTKAETRSARFFWELGETLGRSGVLCN